MTDDDRLRQRLAATDPVRRGGVDTPLTEPSITEIRERIMSTLEQPTSAEPSADTPHTRSTKSLLVAAAAAVVLAAAGVAGAISLTGDGTSDKAGPSALTLQVPSSGVAGSCIQFDVAFLRDMPVAFAGTVTAVTDSAVSLDVDRWYKGGTADTVSVEVPDGQSSAALDGVDFVDGEQYLVTATDGTVNGCGFSGPATPELKKAYAEAFGG
jgi:hypothetical protein